MLEPLRLGDSSALGVGDSVVAMGSPFGLEGTVTSGIVSALHRQMTAPNTFTINDSIQTDAAINHGNSGGPLLDQRGRVIGVNAQIESESGGNDGVGFAIPSNTVRSIVAQLVETGQAAHAYLGVGLLTVPGGVAVTEVKSGTPAEQAELRAATGSRTVNGQQIPTGGDVILALDGQAVSNSAELQSAVDAKRPGDTVSITLLRSGDRRTIRVTLGTRPS
jgi:putative serine protease PepD